MRDLKCYSCLEIGPSEQFLGICQCTENRGVCEKCISKDMSEWAEQPTPDHNLMYLPRLSQEYKDWYNENVCKPMGGDNWSGAIGNADGSTTYTYYECDGITDRKEFGRTFAHKIYDEDFRKSCRKTLTVQEFVGQKFRKDDLVLLSQ